MASFIGFGIAVGCIGAIYAAFVSLIINNAETTTGDSIEREYESFTTSYRAN